MRWPLLSLTGALALVFCTLAFAYVRGGYVGTEGGTPAAATTVKGTLFATVGPGQTITLKRANGTVVKSLAKGRWKVVVDDKSTVHNFHLTGPGVNKLTAVNKIVKPTWTLTFKAGTYKYVCDPHRGVMKGQFTVK